MDAAIRGEEKQEEKEDDCVQLSSAAITHRQICPSCERPLPVCLCHVLPQTPIPTTTKIIILHHPHESRHKLSTVPILSKCLLNSTTLITRRLLPNLSPLLDQSPPSIYLFPPPNPNLNPSPYLTLSQLPHMYPNGQFPPINFVLIVFDATWKHAKEMVRASEDYLGNFATRVCLDCEYKNEGGGSIYDNELLLRKEPFVGCVSTMEAVARALAVIEPNGTEIERCLIRVLREMVRLQAGFLKPSGQRIKMLKKGKQQEKEKGKLQKSGREVEKPGCPEN